MENDIINLLLDHGTFSGRTSQPIMYHTVKTVHSIHVGQKFEDYLAFESAIERYQSAESVQFYKRDSRTVQKAKLCVQKKWPSCGLNQQPPVLKSGTLLTELWEWVLQIVVVGWLVVLGFNATLTAKVIS